MSTLYIRDRIQIDDEFKSRIAPLLASGNLKVVAREIVHAPGYTLTLPGGRLTLICSLYDSRGQAIDVSGAQPGGAGAPGGNGGRGDAIRHMPGEPGSAGGNGAPGAPAGSVRMFCERLTNAYFLANGTAGGAGGRGGDGGHGGDGRIIHHGNNDHEIPGTSGGNGGAGGSGGSGGAAGVATINFVVADSNPRMEASSGAPGDAGAGGVGGRKGSVANGAVDGSRGSAGRAGVPGAPGQAQSSQISTPAYWNLVLPYELGIDSIQWAHYRLRAGEYYYRAYNPTLHPDYLRIAMDEFDAVLVINPSDTQAPRYQSQILSNLNILGKPRDLDVTPNFPAYVDAFQAWGDQIGGVYLQAINNLNQGMSLNNAEQELNRQIANITSGIQALTLESQAAAAGLEAAGKELDHANASVTEIQQQIQVALQEMSHHDFDPLGVVLGAVSTVAEVAGLVVGTIGALVTGPAGLVAFGPALALMASDAYNHLPAIKDQLLKAKQPELDKVKADYADAKRDFDNAVAAGKQVISLVSTIERLIAGTTPDNSKYVNLVKQGVEAAHIQLLAQLHKDQAGLMVEAADARVSAARDTLAAANLQVAALHAQSNVMKDAAFTLIQAARQSIEVLLLDLFKAQRSVEIYCLVDQAGLVAFDTGFVHPDIEQDYRENRIDLARMIAALQTSWSQILTPSRLQVTYENYFDDLDQGVNVLSLSFQDADQLESFRQQHHLFFTINPSDLPNRIVEAKVQAVYVSLVGASAPHGITSCTVRHEGVYTQKTRRGESVSQQLQPHSAIVVSPNTPLQLGGIQLTAGDPITTPQSVSFWGRGLGGSWTLALDLDRNQNQTALSGLTEIQVWIVYQGFLSRR